jgi:hypothetical protein
MKRLFYIATLFWSFQSFSQLKMELTGTSKVQSLYFQNPELEDGRFCVDSVLVNGQQVALDFQQAAFELKITEQLIQGFATTTVLLYHSDGCKPKLLNAGICITR